MKKWVIERGFIGFTPQCFHMTCLYRHSTACSYCSLMSGWCSNASLKISWESNASLILSSGSWTGYITGSWPTNGSFQSMGNYPQSSSVLDWDFPSRIPSGTGSHFQESPEWNSMETSWDSMNPGHLKGTWRRSIEGRAMAHSGHGTKYSQVFNDQRVYHIIWLVVGPPLWQIWKSIGMISNPIYGKIKHGNQTTNRSSDITGASRIFYEHVISGDSEPTCLALLKLRFI